jgi:hypothetical protein
VAIIAGYYLLHLRRKGVNLLPKEENYLALRHGALRIRYLIGDIPG